MCESSCLLSIGNCTVKGQVVKECGMVPTCATTCASRFNFIFCPQVCNGVCECPAGTIIDEDSNECVPPSECPESMCVICYVY